MGGVWEVHGVVAEWVEPLKAYDAVGNRGTGGQAVTVSMAGDDEAKVPLVAGALVVTTKLEQIWQAKAILLLQCAA